MWTLKFLLFFPPFPNFHYATATKRQHCARWRWPCFHLQLFKLWLRYICQREIYSHVYRKLTRINHNNLLLCSDFSAEMSLFCLHSNVIPVDFRFWMEQCVSLKLITVLIHCTLRAFFVLYVGRTVCGDKTRKSSFTRTGITKQTNKTGALCLASKKVN